MALESVGLQVASADSPFTPGFAQIQKLIWTQEIIRYDPDPDDKTAFRADFTFVAPHLGGYIVVGTPQNVTHVFADDAFGAPSVFGAASGLGLYCSSQFQLGLGQVRGGSATSGSTTTLVDSAQTWTPGALVGKSVWVRPSTGSEERRTITANTATSLTWTSALVNGAVSGGVEYATSSDFATGGTTTTLVDAKKNWVPGSLVGQSVSVRITRFGVGYGTEERKTITANTATEISWSGALANGAVVAGVEYTIGRSSLFHLDGFDFEGDPLVYPFFGRGFEDTDSLGGMSKVLYTRGAMPQSFPIVLKWKVEKAGVLKNPAGRLHRTEAGDWVALSDTLGHAAWDVWLDMDGAGYRRLGRFFLRSDVAAGLLSSSPMTHFSEWFIDNAASSPIATAQTKVRYRDMAAFDGRRWYDLLRWKITTKHPNSETDYGIQVESVDNLVSVCGDAAAATSASRTVGHQFFLGLVYAMVNPWPIVNMIYNGVQTRTHGTGSFTGPEWVHSGGGGIPSVQEDSTRGFLILHPSNTPRGAGACYTAKRAGSCRFVGDFARLNDVVSGNGVIVAIYKNAETTPKHQAFIPAVAVPDQSLPFANTPGVSHFDLVLELVANDVVRFVVLANGTDHTFDATAFRMQPSWDPVSQP